MLPKLTCFTAYCVYLAGLCVTKQPLPADAVAAFFSFNLIFATLTLTSAELPPLLAGRLVVGVVDFFLSVGTTFDTEADRCWSPPLTLLSVSVPLLGPPFP